MIVDDSVMVREVLFHLLGEEHYVEAVSSGSEALARIEPGRYDVLLIDLGMPEMPGQLVAREADASIKPGYGNDYGMGIAGFRSAGE